MIIDSETPLKEFFDGYAFSNTDFIIDNDGMEAYRKEGKTFTPDADGCYVHGKWKSEDIFEIETDFRGFYFIYYYLSDNYWCVSNSFYDIVNYLNNKGLSFKLREHSLEQWRSSLNGALQLISNKTIFDEIGILSSDETIQIRSGYAKKENKNRSFIIKESYLDSLYKLVSLWLGRITTLLSDNTTLVDLNLSGGNDSRIMFGLINKAAEISGIDRSGIKINSNKDADRIDDYRIAQYIVERYGYKLHKNSTPFENIKINAYESYETWKKYVLGRYSPLHFPLQKRSNTVISLAGEGGGCFRPVYRGTTFQSTLSRYKKAFRSPDLFEEWRDEAVDAAKAALQKYPDSLCGHSNDMSVAHYREYRGRHHHSKNPHNSIAASFYGSKAFFETAYTAPDWYIDEYQILYDVMYTLDRDLPFIAYDKLTKGPSGLNVSHLANIPIKPDITIGKVYKSINHENNEKRAFHPNRLIVNEAQTALTNPVVKEVIGAEFIDVSKKKINAMIEKAPNKRYQSKGAFLHYIILVNSIADMI